ncbi:hypothetical protein [Szabonella alba]|uniref:FlgN protein n=1 Tax=Szabonella alba TaxID=2804194 RepID=A0A8K0VCX8_9RHOB|nr:hypothetical protein [Szabonella alba]MBL4917007.1 hypothetical protein [Szabonella alba]
MAADPAITLLETLLQETHTALRRGELSRLADLTRRTEQALQDLPAAPSERAVQHLRALAARNAACLEAAGRGIRAARRRLAEIRDAQAGMRIYDDQGRSRLIAPGEGRLARRA